MICVWDSDVAGSSPLSCQCEACTLAKTVAGLSDGEVCGPTKRKLDACAAADLACGLHWYGESVPGYRAGPVETCPARDTCAAEVLEALETADPRAVEAALPALLWFVQELR